MASIESIGRQISESLPKYEADYIELRLEENQTSNIAYRGRNLESVNKSTAVGGNVRALVKGGWGFVSFNSLDEIPNRIEAAVKQAKFIGGEESRLAEVEPVVDTVLVEGQTDPAALPLIEKKQLLDEYVDIIWTTPGIQTSVVGYGDGRKNTIFLNSAGSYIEQERIDFTMRLSVVAAKDSEVTQVGLSLGSRGDFPAMQGLNQKVSQMAERAVDMLSAPQVKGGEYTVILDPVLA
ncbi:MAG: DNA gyrase modulator, partial [Dehalococcoidales bacterium]|nr:DNA gyrase modulator [Dehalococcoidales bacterium]